MTSIVPLAQAFFGAFGPHQKYSYPKTNRLSARSTNGSTSARAPSTHSLRENPTSGDVTSGNAKVQAQCPSEKTIEKPEARIS